MDQEPQHCICEIARKGGGMNFEEFATNHGKHFHCKGCGVCMVDPRFMNVALSYPVWCVGCYKIIDSIPLNIPRPWTEVFV